MKCLNCYRDTQELYVITAVETLSYIEIFRISPSQEFIKLIN
jgi:hypothetical protein